MVALSVPPATITRQPGQVRKEAAQREHRVPGVAGGAASISGPPFFRRPSTLSSVALQYLLDLSAALHFLERLQYRFHRNLRGSRTRQLTAVSSSCAASWSGGCPGAWRLLQCSDS